MVKLYLLMFACIYGKAWVSNGIPTTSSSTTDELKKLDFVMPTAVSSKSDELMCHTMELDIYRHQYILGYNPKASSETAHHMMIYGCKAPASTTEIWKCGGAERDELEICGSSNNGHGGSMGKRIVYAWALDAPEKKLPDGVGLRVGGDTDIKYLVLQLHYRTKFTEGQYDNSGVELTMTYKKQPMQMGFYILGNWGFIPPKQPAFHLESICEWRVNTTIYPFGYRTHSHNLGRVTSAYRIRNNVWTEIGRMSPQQPEMFYDVTNIGLDIKPGDLLAARCTMNSMGRYKDTVIGATNAEEMCNFYFMYSTDLSENLEDAYCFRNAQEFHWADYLKDIPKDASSLKGVHLIDPNMEPNDQLQM